MSSMDFFEQQDQAQRQTKKLVVLFILALCAIVLALVWLATHPPVRERLYRIYGNHVGLLDAPELASAYVSDSEQVPPALAAWYDTPAFSMQ